MTVAFSVCRRKQSTECVKHLGGACDKYALRKQERSCIKSLAMIGGINKYDFKKPVSTNRGVERTNKSAVEAVVDWVQVTFHIALFQQ